MGIPLLGYWRNALVVVGAAGLLGLAGCSTPESRIEKNPSLYQSFPASVRETVKKGKIEIGFTQDMVYIAWGKPDRKREIIEDKTKRTVWVYLGMRQEFDGYDYYPVPRVDKEGRPAGYFMESTPRYTTVYFERASVTFTNGKVSRIVQ